MSSFVSTFSHILQGISAHGFVLNSSVTPARILIENDLISRKSPKLLQFIDILIVPRAETLSHNFRSDWWHKVKFTDWLEEVDVVGFL